MGNHCRFCHRNSTTPTRSFSIFFADSRKPVFLNARIRRIFRHQDWPLPYVGRIRLDKRLRVSHRDSISDR